MVLLSLLTLNQIRELRPDLEQRKLRIIHSGRILADSVNLHEYIQSHAERVAQKEGDTKGKGKEKSTSFIWLHCSVGAELKPGEEDDDGSTQVRTIHGKFELCLSSNDYYRKPR